MVHGATQANATTTNTAARRAPSVHRRADTVIHTAANGTKNTIAGRIRIAAPVSIAAKTSPDAVSSASAAASATVEYSVSLNAYAGMNTSGGYTAAIAAAAIAARGPAARPAMAAISHTPSVPTTDCAIFTRAGTVSTGSVTCSAARNTGRP